MAFRFRRRFRLFPGINLNLSKNGLSSLSIGRPGATVNVPLARDGDTRITGGIPGTGLSWSEELGGGQTDKQPPVPSGEQVIQEVMGTLSGPGHVGDALWRQGLAQRVLDHADTPRDIREAALRIKSPEAAELHLRRAKGPDRLHKASMEVIDAVKVVLAYCEQQGWARGEDD